MIGFTVTDGDGDTATGSLTVNVNDDTPVASTVTARRRPDDEGKAPFRRRAIRTGRATLQGRRRRDGSGGHAVHGGRGRSEVDHVHHLYGAEGDLQGRHRFGGAGDADVRDDDGSGGYTILTATGATRAAVFTLDVAADGSYTFTAAARTGVTDDWYDGREICRS